MTPRELGLYVEGYNDRTRREKEQRQQDKEDQLIAAYLNAMWERSKKMPPLSKVIKDMKPKKAPLKPQTPEQMLAAVKRMQSEFDGKGG